MVKVNIRTRYSKKGKATYGYYFETAKVGGKRKWTSKSGFQTKSEARRAGNIALQQYENYGSNVKNENISFSDFLDYWLGNECANNLKPSTTRKYTKNVNSIIKPKLGGYRLTAITREILQAFIIDVYDLGYSYNSLTVLKGIITKSFNYAVDYRYIFYSPADRLKIPKYRIPKIPTRIAPRGYIPQEIIKKVFERFPEGHPSHIPLKIGYECGLRLGEVFALCWEDVDFVNKIIKVNRQVQWMEDYDRNTLDKISKNGTAECGNGYWYFSLPKYNSCRFIEISDSMSSLLLREKERQLKAKEFYGDCFALYSAEYPLSLDFTALNQSTYRPDLDIPTLRLQ